MKRWFRKLGRSRARRLVLWYVLAACSVVITYLAGPFIQFPIAFVLPVVLAAWFDGVGHALLFAIALPLARYAFVLAVWSVPWGEAYSAANVAVRIIVLSLLAVLTSRVAERQRALRREVAVLQSILPICSFCKKVRAGDETWKPLEVYLQTNGDLEFSHGLCPDCAHQHYPDQFPERVMPSTRPRAPSEF